MHGAHRQHRVGLFKLVRVVLLAPLISAAPAAAPSEHLVGTSFLTGVDTPNRASLRADIQRQVLAELQGLENWTPFATKPKPKALALRYVVFDNPFIPIELRRDHLALSVDYWGAAWNSDSIANAKADALKTCGADCIIYFENDEPVGLGPMVDKYVEVQRAYTLKQEQRFEAAQKTRIIDRAFAEVRDGGIASHTGIRLPIQIGYPDHQQDYASVCENRVFYALEPVAAAEQSSIRTKLKDLAAAGLYGAYDRTVRTTRNYRTPKATDRTTRQMSFASVVSDVRALALPRNLMTDLKNEQVVEAWVEGTARVTRQGVPIDVGDEFRPVAIETVKGLYLGIEIRMPQLPGGCYVSMPFAKPAVRFHVGAKDPSRAQTILNTLLANIGSQLRGPPIAAATIQNEPFAPGEVGLARINAPSFVLGGSTYERSTYLVQTWVAGAADPWGSLYGRDTFQGVGRSSFNEGNDLQIFLKVKHEFTRAAHRLGEYRDPSADEVGKYDSVLVARVQNAIVSTCATYKGKVANSVCLIQK